MINTPWYAKIDAQQLFYFVILYVGGTLIDLSVSMKARLEIYTGFRIPDSGFLYFQHNTTDTLSQQHNLTKVYIINQPFWQK